MASTLLRKEQTELLTNAYPVGALYVSVVSTNPSSLFGFGTWAAYGAGRAMVGYSSGETEFDAGEETGGAKTHALVTGELPSHLHTVNPANTTSGINSVAHTHTYTAYSSTQTYNSGTNQTGVWSGTAAVNTGAQSADHTHAVDIAPFDSASAGSDTAHNNLQPYIVVYIFKRTA